MMTVVPLDVEIDPITAQLDRIESLLTQMIKPVTETHEGVVYAATELHKMTAKLESGPMAALLGGMLGRKAK